MFVCFNRAYTEKDTAIRDFLLDAVSCAESRSKVFGSFFKFGDKDFARDLSSSSGKDSSLKLKWDFVGGNEDDTADSDIVSNLKDLKGRAKLYEADPDGIMNHNKFLVFEEFDFGQLKNKHPKKRVGSLPSNPGPGLYLSSANLTTNSLAKHNNSILVPINLEICDLLNEYYSDLKGEYNKTSGVAALFAGNKIENRYATAKSSRCKVYLYPRRKSSNPGDFVDTLVGVLKNVKHYKRRYREEPCKIRIAVAGWYDTRLELAETLAILSAHGADVKVVSRDPADLSFSARMGTNVRSVLQGRADVYYQRPGTNIHSKYMLIDGPYKSGDSYTRQQLVWTGSPNYSGHAVHNHWEILCKLYESTGAYEHYLADWENLKSEVAVLDA